MELSKTRIINMVDCKIITENWFGLTLFRQKGSITLAQTWKKLSDPTCIKIAMTTSSMSTLSVTSKCLMKWS